MPGVFLVVKSSDVELPPTDGGVPHVTLYYTSKKTYTSDNIATGASVLNQEMGTVMHIEEAVFNSFEKNERMRYDVLLHLDAESSERIDNYRRSCQNKDFIMRQPHVTVCTSYDEEEARVALDKWKAKLSEGKLEIKVIGFTVK